MTRIVLLPGLGADGRLFGPQIEAFPTATVPAWIPPARGESLGSYAERFAASVIEPAAGEDWIAVGFSFGGMVALEIANRLPEDRRPRAVGLISGIRSVRSVSGAFRAQVAIGTAVPGWIAKPVIRGPLTAAFGRVCGLERRWRVELRAMSKDVDWRFLKWAARACCRWDFEGECAVGVHWMHGLGDRVVPYVAHPEFDDALTLVEDGSHLLTWTRADEVDAWIEGLASARGGGRH